MNPTVDQYQIVKARGEHAAHVADTFARAYHPLAVARWLVPDPRERRRVLPAYGRILVDHALAHGQVWQTVDGAAAAGWLPHDSGPLPEPVCYPQQLQRACGDAIGRFRYLDELLAQDHPQAPHHHLAFLAVHPAYLGQGRGRALLEHHLARLDARGVAAYAPAPSYRAWKLCMNTSFEYREAFHLPDGTPNLDATTLYAMWRPPFGASRRLGMVIYL